MERCTACRSRLGETALCPRCGCDFTLAIRAETAAQHLACQALQAWQRGDHNRATACINRSLALKHGHLASTLAAILRESPLNSLPPKASPHRGIHYWRNWIASLKKHSVL